MSPLSPDAIFTLLASFGLSLSAGVRAYLPLVALGIASHLGKIDGFQIKLTPTFSWLGDPVVIGIFVLLTIYEISADKIPVVDHINDVVHTAIRPLSGAVLFTATQNPLTTNYGTAGIVIAAIIGAAIAGTTHAAKAGTRAASTATTAGIANPFISLIEDVLAVGAVVLSIVAPVVAAILIVILALLVARGITLLLRRRRQRRSGQAAVAGPGSTTIPMR